MRESEIAALINSEKLMFANGIAMAFPIPSARGAFFPLPLPLLPLAPVPRASSLLSTLHLDLPHTLRHPSAPLSVLPPFSNVLYLRSGFSSPLFAHPTPPFFLLSLSLSVTLFPSLFSPLPFVRHLPPSRTRATVLSHVQVTLISCATNLADQNWILTITAWSRRYSLYRCVVHEVPRTRSRRETVFRSPSSSSLPYSLFDFVSPATAVAAAATAACMHACLAEISRFRLYEFSEKEKKKNRIF